MMVIVSFKTVLPQLRNLENLKINVKTSLKLSQSRYITKINTV